MNTTTITATTPRVWIGCLACYADGRLVGEWFAAEDADTVTADELHGSSNVETDQDDSPHEELWCFDHEHLPITGECSPTEAAEWGNLLADVHDWQRDALLAWVRSGDYTAIGRGDLPSLPDFDDRYAGHWDSFRDYAESLADDIGLLTEVPETLAAYFDWAAWTRDLAYDYTTTPAADGGVYVFRSL